MDAKTIIIGGGCAGMQLIHSLLQLPYEITGDIILIEKEQTPARKSWCFWTKEQTIYDTLINKKWTSVQFCASGVNIQKHIAPYTYNYINSEDFFDYHHQIIKQSNRVKLVHDTVNKIDGQAGKFTVHTNQHQYQSQQVYNSNLALDQLVAAQPILLWQHFKGWFIKTEKPVFDTQTATLMDFELEQNGAAHFMYVLPFSATEALIEFTSFSQQKSYPEDIYTAYLKDYIKSRWKTDFEIQKEESGKIPMTNYPFRKAEKNGIINIGSAAGAIKPTTGYAFNRIMKDTHHIIQSITAPQNRKNISPQRFQFYDTLLLQIIQQEPAQVQRIMSQLFSKNDWNAVLRFLDEDSNLADEITLFSSLPKRLFLKQVYQYARSK